MDFAKLTKDLTTSKNYAIIVGTKDNEDGGTCNFDTFVLLADYVRFDLLKTAVENAGLRVSKWGRGRYHIFGYEWGQGNLRTRMVEAFETSMRNLGYKTSVYYAMD